MTRLALILVALALASAANAACPTQPATLVAVAGHISICSDEPTTAVQIERQGIILPALPIALEPGVTVDLTGYTQCSAGTLRARGINEAGPGPWGAAVPASFPGCLPPVLLRPVP